MRFDKLIICEETNGKNRKKGNVLTTLEHGSIIELVQCALNSLKFRENTKQTEKKKNSICYRKVEIERKV